MPDLRCHRIAFVGFGTESKVTIFEPGNCKCSTAHLKFVAVLCRQWYVDSALVGV